MHLNYESYCLDGAAKSPQSLLITGLTELKPLKSRLLFLRSRPSTDFLPPRHLWCMGKEKKGRILLNKQTRSDQEYTMSQDSLIGFKTPETLNRSLSPRDAQ